MSEFGYVNFVVYDAQENIKRTGVCREADLLLQAGPGEKAIIGEADDLTDKVDPRTKQILRNVKSRPSPVGPTLPLSKSQQLVLIIDILKAMGAEAAAPELLAKLEDSIIRRNGNGQN